MDLDSHSQYIFAAKLYECLTSEGELYFHEKDEKINPSIKKALKTSLRDYFKLVGKLN